MIRGGVFLNSLAALFFFVHPVVALALETPSNPVSTRVGNPKIEAEGILGAAEMLKSAYDVCGDGYTHQKTGLVECLQKELTSLGANPKGVQTVGVRHQGTVFGGCTQCLGFISLAFGLLMADPSALGLDDAADVAVLPGFTISGELGTLTYQRIPADQAKPGDIAAHALRGAGHIAVVKTVEGAIFTAVESNGNNDCRVTNDRRVPKEGYVFFSSQ